MAKYKVTMSYTMGEEYIVEASSKGKAVAKVESGYVPLERRKDISWEVASVEEVIEEE